MKIVTLIKHTLRLSYCYVVTRVLFIFHCPPKVINSLSSIEEINAKKMSVTRFGDGELMLINGQSIKFQDYDKNLALRLKKILTCHDQDIAVCMPAIYKFNITRSLKYNEEVFWLYQIINYHDLYLNKELRKRTYFDSCLTRPYIRYKNHEISPVLFNNLKKIWQDEDLLIVEGKYSRLGVNNDLFQNVHSIKRILCPNKNAYTYYEEILKLTKKYAKKKLVLIALGPTATVLAYDLYQSGLRAIDLGHIDLEYEWFLNKVEEKTLVKNKIVNEVEEDNELQEELNEDYQNSIITIIKEN